MAEYAAKQYTEISERCPVCRGKGTYRASLPNRDENHNYRFCRMKTVRCHLCRGTGARTIKRLLCTLPQCAVCAVEQKHIRKRGRGKGHRG
jgi:hypothetical protein